MGSQGKSSTSPLVVKKSQVVIVKPSKPTPDVSLSLSTLDNDPYIETLAKTIYVYSSPSSKEVQDPASLLQEALSHALVHYYPLAGKLSRRSDDHRLELKCAPGEGVPFVKATAECTLASLNYLEDMDADLNQLVPSYEAVAAPGGYNVLALQVTVFACGGITLATALSHSLCDGFGASQFFKAFTEFAAGKTQPSIVPVWDRHCLTPNNFNINGQAEEDQAPKLVDFVEACSSAATSPYTPTNDMVSKILNFTPQDITHLKEKVPEEVTTLEILAAHVWRARCKALNLSPEGTTLFGMAVGIRRTVDPPLREGYYGNAFVKANVAMKAGELLSNSSRTLSHVVKLIKEAKREALKKRYVSEQLKETEKSLKMKVACQGGNGAFMLLTDWRQLGLLDEVDFGYGGSVNIVPVVPKFLSDICVFLPRKQGGVRVLVTLPKRAMDSLMEHMNPLSL